VEADATASTGFGPPLDVRRRRSVILRKAFVR
jgi:hypothetical protein